MAKKATNNSPTRKAKAGKQKSFEETLWDSANKLRGSVEPSEYKHVVLSLIFLKFASDKFEERRQAYLILPLYRSQRCPFLLQTVVYYDSGKADMEALLAGIVETDFEKDEVEKLEMIA